MKSEPHGYPWEQLVEDKSTHWDGVRNYQARNTMRDDMKIGDFVLFYHSNTKPPHVAGIAKICREGYPDFTAQDPDSNSFDAKATPENPPEVEPTLQPSAELGRLPTINEDDAEHDMDALILESFYAELMSEEQIGTCEHIRDPRQEQLEYWLHQ